MPFGGHEMTRGSKIPAQPQPSDAEPLRRLRAGGRDPDRDHQRTRADAVPVDGQRRQRRHPQPVGPDPHARRLVGRLGRRGRRRTGCGGGRLRWRRLDPDPGRLLRPGRDEADAWPRLARSRSATAGSVSRRTVRLRARSPTARCCSTRCTAPLRATLQRRAAVRDIPRGRADAAAQAAADRDLDASFRSARWRGCPPTSASPSTRPRDCSSELGHEVVERDPDYGLVSLEFIQTYLRGAHEEFQTLTAPALAERSTRQLAAPVAGSCRRAGASGCSPDARGRSRGSQNSGTRSTCC